MERIEEIRILKTALKAANIDSTAGIIFEFLIPRRNKRIDAVLLIEGIIFVLEFKISLSSEAGASYKRKGIEQCEDYSLDLRDFHEESKNKKSAKRID